MPAILSAPVATPAPEAVRLYYYRPIGSPESKAWKCAGFGAEDAAHRAFYTDYFAKTASPECGLAAGVRIASHYLGDRVALIDLERNAA